jgi:predicted DNA-binding antitoxin AbrB/MazE fold protein
MPAVAGTRVVATFANGVFTPLDAIDLPENAKVELTVTTVSGAESAPAPGSPQAIDAFIKFCKERPLRTGAVWNGRDELYDDRI